MEMRMSTIALDSLSEIETAIAEAFERVERQRRLISEFQAKGYDVTAPTTLLSCLLVNLRTLEDRRLGEMRGDTVAL
jgi:hypothetical protein